MGTALVAGQNAKLGNPQLTFQLNVGKAGGGSVEASAILLAPNGKVSSDDDFIFFNQPSHPSMAVSLSNNTTFSVDLSKVPGHLERIAFILTLEQGLEAMGSGYGFQIQCGSDEFHFEGQSSGRLEKSLIVAELYQRNGDWKIKVVDQGFAGGMAPLAEHFGVEVDGGAKPGGQGQSAPAPEPAPQSTKDKPINLSKITLEKKGDTISLEKKSGSFGKIHVNLNWNQAADDGKKGLLGSLLSGGKSGGIDLDLGCMFEFRNGEKGIVQALGKHFGSLDSSPYIYLDGDDRTGAVNAGENLYINGAHWNDVQRIMIFAFIYEGVPNWSKTDGGVTIKAPDQPDIEIRMDATGSNQNFCVIGMLENRDGALHISKEVNYFPGHSQADDQYGFGFRWKAGRK